MSAKAAHEGSVPRSSSRIRWLGRLGNEYSVTVEADAASPNSARRAADKPLARELSGADIRRDRAAALQLSKSNVTTPSSDT
jgi:hypothetical protein